MKKIPHPPPMYYFALGPFLADMKLSQSEARARFGFDQKGGEFYISRTGFGKLCNRPALVRTPTLNILCRAMGISPADLWRKDEK